MPHHNSPKERPAKLGIPNEDAVLDLVLHTEGLDSISPITRKALAEYGHVSPSADGQKVSLKDVSARYVEVGDTQIAVDQLFKDLARSIGRDAVSEPAKNEDAIGVVQRMQEFELSVDSRIQDAKSALESAKSAGNHNVDIIETELKRLSILRKEVLVGMAQEFSISDAGNRQDKALFESPSVQNRLNSEGRIKGDSLEADILNEWFYLDTDGALREKNPVLAKQAINRLNLIRHLDDIADRVAQREILKGTTGMVDTYKATADFAITMVEQEIVATSKERTGSLAENDFNSRKAGLLAKASVREEVRDATFDYRIAVNTRELAESQRKNRMY